MVQFQFPCAWQKKSLLLSRKLRVEKKSLSVLFKRTFFTRYRIVIFSKGEPTSLGSHSSRWSFKISRREKKGSYARAMFAKPFLLECAAGGREILDPLTFCVCLQRCYHVAWAMPRELIYFLLYLLTSYYPVIKSIPQAAGESCHLP